MTKNYDGWVRQVALELEEANIGYCFIGETALRLQGVAVDTTADLIQVSIQWDLLETASLRFEKYLVQETQQSDACTLTLQRDEVYVELIGYYHTVVETDKHRISVPFEELDVWVKSLYAFCSPEGQQRAAYESRVADYLKSVQERNNDINQQAWSDNTYEAWIVRHGLPLEAARKIAKNPSQRLQPLLPLMGSVAGKRIMNLLGSHGSKAVALALLGANVTVVDISPENERYARELAEAAGVDLRYVLSDVLQLPPEENTNDYDIVFMELGILHYFVDLQPLIQVTVQLLAKGGRLILQDFHPISTKLITSKGKKHKVSGNYFEASLVEQNVAFSKYGTSDVLPQVRLRKWTLGEVVTAVARAGLRICALEEDPNHKLDDRGIPKTFTLVAEK